MRRLFFLCVSSALVIVSGPLARTAAAAGPTTRTVYVTVVDGKGQPAAGLTAADFGLKEGGKVRDIVSAEPAKEKARIAVLVEEALVSQEFVRQGLAEFAKRVCPQAEMALMVVRNRNETAVPYTSDPGAIIDGINKLPLSLRVQLSAVAEGVAEISKVFEREKPARPAVVLLALDAPQSSDELAQNILDDVAKSRATLWSVPVAMKSGSASSVRRLADTAVRAQVMGDGPKQSGGQALRVEMLTAVTDALQQVANDLAGQYLITYTLPESDKPSDRLEVTLTKAGLTLRAPTRTSKK